MKTFQTWFLSQRAKGSVLMLVLLSAGCSLFSHPVASGIVKTVNGGTDWTFSNTVTGAKVSPLQSLSISKMFFDPTNREIVYAGGYNGGLYKSTDSGSTWKEILSNILVYDAVMNPSDTKTIYVAGYFSDHGRVIVTHDGGTSWQQTFNEESMQNPVRSIALNPADPKQVIIGTATGELIKSLDGGQNWQILHNFLAKFTGMVWQGSGLYILTREKGLQKSTDLGLTFQSLNGSLITSNTNTLFEQQSTGPESFYQFYVSQINPNLLYMTTDLGLYKSADEGKTWVNVRLPIKNGTQEAHAIAVSQTTSSIVYTSSGTTVYKSVDAGLSWQTQKIATTGVINYILIDPQLPQIVYAGVYSGQ